MATIYLHIGSPKTGTTAIQKFLTKNAKTLKKIGYSFPDFGIRYPHVGEFRNGYFISRMGGDCFLDEREQSWKMLEEELQNVDNVILSDEAIWMRQRRHVFWERIRKKVEELGAEVCVIVYLRRQDLLMESFWNQKTKYNGNTLTFDEFVETHDRLMPMRYGKRLDIIQDKLKPRRICVRVFEPSQLYHENVVSDFCREIGIKEDSVSLEYDKKSNPSLSLNSIELKRILNQVSGCENTEDFYRNIIGKFDARSRKQKNNLTTNKTTAFSFEERKLFLQRFEEDNMYVAKKYLEREDGRLFIEPLAPSEKWVPDAAAMQPLAIQTLGATDVMLFERIVALEEKLDQLYNSFPLKLYRKLHSGSSQKK